MKYRFLCFFLLTCLLNAQTGYVKIPDQLYQSIDNKKPGGAELFHKRKTNPSSIDLSDRMPKPGYQGPIGSCAAWATGYACKTYQESVEWGFDPLDEKRQFSPSFIYNLVNEGKNKGTTFPKVFDIVKDKGCATLQTMPYTHDYLKKPDEAALQEAAAYKISDYKRLQNGDGLIPAVKSSLADGKPVIAAMKVYDNFKKLKNTPYTEIRGERSGGHGMCIVGYDDEHEMFKLINSWGRSWGEAGYCRIAYDLMNDLILEAYVTYDVVEKQSPDRRITAPKDLSASRGSYPDQVILEWKGTDEADAYMVYRSNNKNEKLEFKKLVRNNSYTDNDVLNNVKYIYSVRSKCNSKTSDLCEVACGWASKNELGTPGHMECRLEDGIAVLTWKKVPDAEIYYIYRLMDGKEKYQLTAQSQDEIFRDISIQSNPKKDLSYYYMVSACRGNEESDMSNMDFVTIPKTREDLPIPNMDKQKNQQHASGSDIILPEKNRKVLKKNLKKMDFYDKSYMERFFEEARKAEEEAFRKIRENENKYFDEYRKYEEEMRKKFK